jgi:hypothetical protein
VQSAKLWLVRAQWCNLESGEGSMERGTQVWYGRDVRRRTAECLCW